MTALAAVFLAATFTRPMLRVSTMDPAQSRSIYDAHAVSLVCQSPLSVDYEARPYAVAPGLCDLPEVSADRRTYRFRLRTDAVTADDVVRAIVRLRDPASPNGWIVKDIVRAEPRDVRTLEIVLGREVRYFNWLMTMPALGVLDRDGRGTGPYRLRSWRKNHEMVFERRDPAAHPRGFDTVRYVTVEDASTQWLMFLKGELDLLDEISRDNWDSVVGADGRLVPSLAEKGVKLHLFPSLEVAYVGMNMHDRVLGPNRALRQALNAAFDFPVWSRFYNGCVGEAGGPVPPGVGGRLAPEGFPYRFDLALAKRRLAEAGYPDGIDPRTGRRLVLTLAIGRADQASREAGELLASFYARIGIRLELDFMTWDSFLKAVAEGRTQLYRMGWIGDYPDAQNFLQLFYGPNANPGVNHSDYANAEYDAAYEREDWRRCQEILREDCPWVFAHVRMSSALTGPRMTNYRPGNFPYGNEQYYENAVH